MHPRLWPLCAYAALSGAMFALTGCNKKTDLRPLLEHAAATATAGKLDSAKIEYAKILALDPQNAVANARVGLIWAEQGAPLRAIPYLVKAQQADPKNLEVRLKLAYAFMSVGQMAPAKREAKEILGIQPDHKPALLLLAETVQSSGDYEYAENALRREPQPASEHAELASATLGLRRGDIGRAHRALLRAVKAAPQSATAHLSLAQCLLLQNNIEEAEAELKTAAELANPRSAVHTVYAAFLSERGDAPGAMAYLTKIAEEVPDYLPAWHMIAQVAGRQKQFEAASAALEQILRRDPSHYDAKLLTAQLLLARGETAKGIEALEALGAAYPNLAADKFALAREALKARDVERALSLLKKTLAANPDHVDAALALGELNLRKKQYGNVIALMMDLLDRRPTVLKAQILLVDGLRLSGDLASAEKVMQEQTRLFPRSAGPYYFLALIQAQQRMFDEARRNLEKSLEFAPDHLPTQTALVDINLAEGKLALALQQAQTVCARMPNAAEAHFLEAKVHAAMNAWDKAEAGFSKTLELDPNHLKASDLLVYAYAAQNKLPQKLADTKAALEQDPKDTRRLRIAGIIHLRLGEFDPARDVYERLLALQPNAIHVLNDLAYLYSESFNQLERAEALARQARELDASSPHVADTLGWILYKRENYEPAFELLQEASLRLPLDPEVQFHLGMASRKVGRNEVAARALDRAAKTPGFNRAETAARELKALQN